LPYCEKCGTQVNPEANFCKNCGAKLNPIPVSRPAETAPIQSAAPAPQPTPVQPQVQPAPIPTYQPPAPTIQPTQTPPTSAFQQPAPQAQPAANVQTQTPSQSQVIAAIAFRKPKSFGRYDSFTGVITAQQLIFAQMTSDMVKDAAMQARDQAKADGKGFWGQWSDQLKASFGYTKKYLTMDPAAIIAETPGNFAIENNSISEIKLKIKYLNQENTRHEWEVQIHSFAGKYEFRMDDNNDYVELLKRVYPERVKMPFGYFSKGGVKIKLF
jgi:hypothetical protein